MEAMHSYINKCRLILVRGLRQDLLLILGLFSYFEVNLVVQNIFCILVNQVIVPQLREYWTHYLEVVGSHPKSTKFFSIYLNEELNQ